MRPDLLILLMSGRTDLMDLNLENFNDICYKSFPLSVLCHAIATLLNERP